MQDRYSPGFSPYPSPSPFRFGSDRANTRRYHIPFRVSQYLRSLCWGPGSRTILHAEPGNTDACLPNPRAPGLASAGLVPGGTAMCISRAWMTDCADDTMPNGASMTPSYHDIMDCVRAARATGGSETLVVFPSRAWAVSVPLGATHRPWQTEALLRETAGTLTSWVGSDRGFEYADRWCGVLERCGFRLRLMQSDQPWDVRMA